LKKAFILPKHFGHSAKVLTGKKKNSGNSRICMLADTIGQIIKLENFAIAAHHSTPSLSHGKESVDKTNIRT